MLTAGFILLQCNKSRSVRTWRQWFRVHQSLPIIHQESVDFVLGQKPRKRIGHLNIHSVVKWSTTRQQSPTSSYSLFCHCCFFCYLLNIDNSTTVHITIINLQCWRSNWHSFLVLLSLLKNQAICC